MHWEYSHFYPAIAMSSHVTNWNKKSSIKFRVDVASIGKLGFDIALEKLSEEEKEFCKQALLNYKSFRNIIWYGDIYRLQNPYENPIASIQYVDDDKSSSVAFSFLVSDRFQSFYTQFKNLGIARELTNSVENWSYDKLDEVNRIAPIIKEKMKLNGII